MEAVGEQFNIKTFETSKGFVSIVLQNLNGPCALVALCNLLVLKNSPMAQFIKSQQSTGSVSSAQLASKLVEILQLTNKADVMDDQFMGILSHMDKGLEVNPKFNGKFENSPELAIFSAFSAKLAHGWVLGDFELAEIGSTDPSLANLSYERYCDLQFSNPVPELTKFISIYPSQLTNSGYLHLQNELKREKLAVLFWNNHFSTVMWHDSKLMTLVSDLGYEAENNIVWEELSLSGAGKFYTGDFQIYKPENPAENANGSKASVNNARTNTRTNDLNYGTINNPQSAYTNSTNRSNNAHRTTTQAPTTSSARNQNQNRAKKQLHKGCCLVM